MNALTGTPALIRLILRRDRIRLAGWFGIAALLVIGVAAAMPATLPGEAAREAFVRHTNTDPTQILAIGPVYGDSEGAVAAWRVRGQAALLVALAGILAVIRHTRADEEAGRRELLGATVLGRHAPLTAALAVVAGAGLACGAAIAAGLMALGRAPGGSIAMGLSVAAVGWAFAAVAAVAAQLSESSRGATGLAAGAMGAFYALRAAADISGVTWLAWLTPFGWTQQVRPFAGDHLWPVAFTAAMCVPIAGAAYLLSARRDLGSGLLPSRPGPAGAAPRLRTPIALAWRLHRGALLGWLVAFTLFGAGLGAVARSAADLVAASPALGALVDGGGRPVDGYFAIIIYIISQVVCVYAIQAVLRLRSEETEGRADPILTGPVGRLRWAGGHLLIAALGSAAVLAGAGLGAGLAYGAASGDIGGELPTLLLGSLVRVPSVWVLAALAAALYGLAPRAAALGSYTALGLLFALEFAVELVGAPHAVLIVSPFAWTPAVPVAAPAAAPPVALSAVAAVLTASGLAGLRRRDLA
ncbi:ABC transporter permease [Nocardiopsis sediminis]|uniref:ABC transporter permease n=1 Tax=Nocardiopsis sediminis TaxID=1778267 RepID=A0ABV8FV31_9ACTN